MDLLRTSTMHDTYAPPLNPTTYLLRRKSIGRPSFIVSVVDCLWLRLWYERRWIYKIERGAVEVEVGSDVEEWKGEENEEGIHSS